MKNIRKIIAIMAAVLMLCAMVPFATVAAADEPTVQISVVNMDEEPIAELNAGDEFKVIVNLLNIPDPGLIGVKVKVDIDSDVFELPAYFDEDEEAWLPQIEVGSKYNASSNKYITFPQIDEEAGVAKACLVLYTRGTASSGLKNEHFFTATLKVKDDAVSGTYDLNAVNLQFSMYGGATAPTFATENASVVVNGVEDPGCKHEYFYACDKICMLCYEETNPDADHNIIHAEAKPATCTELGNKEHWYCEHCGAAWLDEDLLLFTNLMSVRIPYAHEFTDDCDADCNICGYVLEQPLHDRAYACSTECSACGATIEATIPHNFEYACSASCGYCGIANPDAVDHTFVDGFCSECGEMDPYACFHEYFYPCDQYCMNCFELTNPDATHTLTHVEAVEATCQMPGNIEYWTCADCGSCWDNEQCAGIPLNRMNVITFADHTYDDDADLDCNVCGEIREVDITIVVLTDLGTSACKEVTGLAFKFAVRASNVIVENFNEYVSGSVNPYDEGDCSLVRMGAVVSNVEGAALNLDSLDGAIVKDVNAKYLLDTNSEDGEIAFAVRIINIPNVGKNASISACPYFIYEMDGVENVFYGDVVTDTYNSALNG